MERNASRDIVSTALPRVGKFGGSSFFGMNPIGLEATHRLALPATFPNGAQASVLITFDVEGFYGNGTGSEELEIRNYDRICRRLSDLGLKATFNIVGLMAREKGPGFVRTIHNSGNEVAGHGYVHELKTGSSEYTYHGHYGLAENLDSIRRCIDTLSGITGAPVRGLRMPYGHVNEFTYEALQSVKVEWTSNVGMEDLLTPGLGYGPAPFRPKVNGRVYDFVEIPLDTQTYDWAMWIADHNNQSFIDRVEKFKESRRLNAPRTPSGAAAIWRERVRKTVEDRSIFTLLCHPINLTVLTGRWGDPVEEFLFPVFKELAEIQKNGKVWVATCGEMAKFYRTATTARSEN